MRSFRVETDRPAMQVHESGPQDDVPVVALDARERWTNQVFTFREGV